jgi:hypothetical protein
MESTIFQPKINHQERWNLNSKIVFSTAFQQSNFSTRSNFQRSNFSTHLIPSTIKFSSSLDSFNNQTFHRKMSWTTFPIRERRRRWFNSSLSPKMKKFLKILILQKPEPMPKKPMPISRPCRSNQTIFWYNPSNFKNQIVQTFFGSKSTHSSSQTSKIKSFKLSLDNIDSFIESNFKNQIVQTFFGQYWLIHQVKLQQSNRSNYLWTILTHSSRKLQIKFILRYFNHQMEIPFSTNFRQRNYLYKIFRSTKIVISCPRSTNFRLPNGNFCIHISFNLFFRPQIVFYKLFLSRIWVPLAEH